MYPRFLSLRPAGLVALAWLIVLQATPDGRAEDRPRVEVPYGDQLLTVEADTIETTQTEIIAKGSTITTYEDSTLSTERIVYDTQKQVILIEGAFLLTRGSSRLSGTRAEINVDEGTGVIYNASGYTDAETHVRVEKLTRTGPTTYLAENGYITACEEEVPKWSFKITRATIDTETNTHLRNTLFRVKNFPVLYFPYLIVPSEKRPRSSGFLLPTTGTSSNKGRRITNRFYFTLGRSADVFLQQDYYSRRGIGSGFTLRARPNPWSRLDIAGEFVDDRLNQGGSSLEGIGITRFANGFRAAADFSLVSNFRFRQTFSDNFFTATRPTEESRLFLTNNLNGRSLNILVAREETTFSGRNAVTQAAPSMQLRLMGQRLPGLPVHLDLESSVSGMNRSDSLIETPRVSQRIDVFPKAYFSVPLFQGLRLTPAIGLRETFYSDGLEVREGGREVTGNSVHRQYLEIDLELAGWGLSRIFGGQEDDRRWKHVIEPELRYRLIDGIDNFHRIIRFDALDAVAETNEIEWGLVNRLFTKQSGDGAAREWLSVKVSQKIFLDPEFGGAVEEGAINQFFPLNTLTGLPYALGARDQSPVITAVRFSPTRRTSFDFQTDFDGETGDVNAVSLTGFVRRDQLTLATTYFKTQELTAGLGETHQIQGRVGLGDQDRGLSTFTVFSYDALQSRFLNYLVRTNYFWDCCGVSVEVAGFSLSNREEQQIRFSFFLKGIGSFGNIRRPDAVF